MITLTYWQIGTVFAVGFVVGAVVMMSFYMWNTYSFKKAYEKQYGPQDWA